MLKIYSKVDPNVLLLIINRAEDITEKRTDLSPSEEYLQVSTKKLTLGTSFAPHKHNFLKRVTEITQEAWVFLSGAVEAKFWDIDNSLIHEAILKSGDCAIVYRAGHSFKVLEDNTKLYEVKTGPYYGVEKDKTFIIDKED